jgi:hypothetical protein
MDSHGSSLQQTSGAPQLADDPHGIAANGTSLLTSLPDSLLSRISSQLHFDDLLALAATCSALRSYVEPRLRDLASAFAHRPNQAAAIGLSQLLDASWRQYAYDPATLQGQRHSSALAVEHARLWRPAASALAATALVACDGRLSLLCGRGGQPLALHNPEHAADAEDSAADPGYGTVGQDGGTLCP